MKFTFTCTDDDGTSVTKTFTSDLLPNLIDHFDSFVRGCGFFPVGEIQDVESDDDREILRNISSLDEFRGAVR